MVDTTIIDEVKAMIKKKCMTPEEKKERKKVLQREYMAKRRANDPEFAQKQRELCNARKKILREDKEYLEKEREYCKIYYRKNKKDVLKAENIGE